MPLLPCCAAQGCALGSRLGVAAIILPAAPGWASPAPLTHPFPLRFAPSLTTPGPALHAARCHTPQVDATEEKDVAGKHEVQGYPTLKWFVNGKVAMDFGGGRTA